MAGLSIDCIALQHEQAAHVFQEVPVVVHQFIGTVLPRYQNPEAYIEQGRMNDILEMLIQGSDGGHECILYCLSYRPLR